MVNKNVTGGYVMNVLDQLHQEHINLNRLLDILDNHCRTLEQQGQPNFPLVLDVIEYISHYADVHHHPREDSLYAYFAGRDLLLDEAQLFCTAEHQRMRAHTHALRESLDGILNDAAVVPLERVANQLLEFVQQQRGHLAFEERRIFPAIDRIATDEDWATLAKELPQPMDPLFGERQADQYRVLYKEMVFDLQKAG
jgi:hemerythrin-like domain-containing protein